MKTGKILIILLLAAILGMVGYQYLTTPEKRTTGEKIGAAIDALESDGPGKALDELEDRTPGQKLGDAISDFGDVIKENTHRDAQ